jgi:NitT/TauT family transport system substrate-binding protein
MLLTRTTIFCLSLLISNVSLAKETLRVGYLPIMDHLILPVSHALDNPQYQHLDVQPRLFKKWTELAGALKANKIDAAFVLAPLAMKMFQNGLDIKTILLAHRDGSAITVTKNSSIQNAADLKGKRIAIPGHKSTHVALLDSYLKKSGLSLENVTLKSIAPPNMQKAMELGFIDGFIVAEPFGSKAVKQNVGNLLVLSREILPNHIDCIVVINNTFLTTYSEAVKEWIASLIKASQWIEHDRVTSQAHSVANLVSGGHYFSHTNELIINALTEPLEKISFTNLKPDIKDFEVILNIGKEAGIIDHIDLTHFIDDRVYPIPLK